MSTPNRARIIFCAAALCMLSGPTFANWEYSNSEDKMTGGKATYAEAKSDNSLSLEFPYQGPNYGYLNIRSHPKYGLSVYLVIDKGQILCRHYDNCKISVRFDSDRAQYFAGRPAADHSSNVVFLGQATGFLARAKKAKKILIQTTIYQAGDQVFEFTFSSPLKWQETETQKKTSPQLGKKASISDSSTTSCINANLSAEGECGVLYAKCSIYSNGMQPSIRQQFMSSCLRNGFDFAREERDAQLAREGPHWPPPGELTGKTP